MCDISLLVRNFMAYRDLVHGSMITTTKQAEVEVQNALTTLVVMISNHNF